MSSETDFSKYKEKIKSILLKGSFISKFKASKILNIEVNNVLSFFNHLLEKNNDGFKFVFSVTYTKENIVYTFLIDNSNFNLNEISSNNIIDFHIYGIFTYSEWNNRFVEEELSIPYKYNDLKQKKDKINSSNTLVNSMNSEQSLNKSLQLKFKEQQIISEDDGEYYYGGNVKSKKIIKDEEETINSIPKRKLSNSNKKNKKEEKNLVPSQKIEENKTNDQNKIFKFENGKKLVRKIRIVKKEKTYEDEKGYIVDQLVDSEEEYWEEESKQNDLEKPLNKPNTTNTTKQNKNTKGSGNVNITNFFKK